MIVQQLVELVVVVPQVGNYGPVRQKSIGNHWNVEAVFPTEIFRIFSDDFRPVPAGEYGKLTGIHWKKSNKFPVGILPPLPAISVAFLQDPVTFPLLSCRILRDPVAVIFDMGQQLVELVVVVEQELMEFVVDK